MWRRPRPASPLRAALVCAACAAASGRREDSPPRGSRPCGDCCPARGPGGRAGGLARTAPAPHAPRACVVSLVQCRTWSHLCRQKGEITSSGKCRDHHRGYRLNSGTVVVTTHLRSRCTALTLAMRRTSAWWGAASSDRHRSTTSTAAEAARADEDESATRASASQSAADRDGGLHADPPGGSGGGTSEAAPLVGVNGGTDKESSARGASSPLPAPPPKRLTSPCEWASQCIAIEPPGPKILRGGFGGLKPPHRPLLAVRAARRRPPRRQ